MGQEWSRIKKSILDQWDKLTHKDLDERRNNKSGILDLIKSKYPHDDRYPEELDEILAANGEKFYEYNQTSPRSSGTSQIQDQIGNFDRGQEVQAFEKKAQEIAQKHINDASPFQG